MKKQLLIKYSLPIILLLILTGLFLIIPSCGGGGGGGGSGGGGGGNSGIPYTGLTTQASLTATNANKFFAVMWYQGASSATVSPKPSLSKAGQLEYSFDSELMPYISRIGKRLVNDAVGYKSRSQTVNSPVPVNETYYGSISGTLTITGSIDSNTLTGNLTMTYVNFNDGDGYTSDGVVSVRIDVLTNALTDMTMSFSLWTIKTASYDMSMSGSIRLQESTLTISDTMTINVVTRDNASKDISRFENYVQTMTYNSVTNPTSGSETYSGRVYAGKYGYVDVSTISPCIYSNPQAVPDSGGPIVLSGAGNTKAHITPLSTSNVKIEVDDDGDGAFECENCHLWSDLYGPPIWGGVWTIQTSGTTRNLYGVTWSGTNYVAIGDIICSGTCSNSVILTSQDGLNWTTHDSGTIEQLYGVAWSGSKFVAVGTNGTIATSTDGVTWASEVFGTTNALRAVTWSGTQFVAVGDNGMIITSPNGGTWTEQTSDTTKTLMGVTWSGSQFVAVGGTFWSALDGTILTSPDGVAWTKQSPSTSYILGGVVWSGTQFVAVGYNGTIVTSPDGMTWTGQTSGTTALLHSVCWSGTHFAAVGATGGATGGQILTSPDGAHWTVQVTGKDTGFNGVTSSGKMFVAVGYFGWIVTSQ